MESRPSILDFNSHFSFLSSIFFTQCPNQKINKIALILAIAQNHLFINPIVNPADILPVNGIPKLVIANEEAVAAAWISPPLIPGICIIIIAFESCNSTFRYCLKLVPVYVSYLMILQVS